MAVSNGVDDVSNDTLPVFGHIHETSVQENVSETRLRNALQRLEAAAEDIAWDVRWGERDGYVLWDGSDVVVLGLPDGGRLDVPDVPDSTLDAAYACHDARANVYERDRTGLQGREDDQWLFLTPTEGISWRRYLEDELGTYAPIDLQVDFACPKWDDYDVSALGWAEYPGRHGTLRTEVKVQGFPTHRPNSKNSVRMYTQLEHVETGRTFEEKTHEYEVPKAESLDQYPHLPQIRESVYNALLDAAGEYRDTISEEFELCERCGTYERPTDDLFVVRVIDPRDGWQRKFCTECHSALLNEAYGVTKNVGRVYALRSAGLEFGEVAERLGEPEDFVHEMAQKVCESVRDADNY